MADPPLQLADVQIGAAITDNWWRPTAYFQRYLQDNNSRITAAIVGVQDALDQLTVQQAAIVAQQAAFDKFQRSAQGTAGLAGGTTGSGGTFSFPHGYPSGNPLYFPPSVVYSSVFSAGGAVYSHIQIDFVSSTDVHLFVFDAAGVLAPSGTPVSLSWHVAGA